MGNLLNLLTQSVDPASAAAPPRAATVFAMALAALTGACGGSTQRAHGELRGVMLPTPIEKVDFMLTTTEGNAFAFREHTDEYVTLLFFGYTHCPDVCPVHMANIAAVLAKLPPGVSSQIRVVMVTTDPERDSPERLRQWLDAFDPSFVGLRGSIDTVNAIQRTLGLPTATRLDDDPESYAVGHASQVVAFTRDHRAHVVYPFGTRQSDWAHDLPVLVRADW